mgnify:CR=1 FL=1
MAAASRRREWTVRGHTLTLPPGRFALLLAGAALLALFGNALRAAGLFYLETGLVAWAGGPALHEAVGLAAFALVGGGALALPRFARMAR